MIFLTNPKKGKRRMAKKRRTPAQRRATAKLVALNKRRRTTRNPPKKRRKKATTRRTTAKRKITRRKTAKRVVRRKPVTRRKKVATKRRATRRRTTRKSTRRRSTSITYKRVPGKVYRTNPRRFSVRGLLKQAQQGAVDAAGVVVGKAATRIVANLVPIPKSGAVMNFVVQAGAAIVVGTVAGMVVSKDMARMVIAGGFAAPIEGFAKGIPFIGPMLGDDYLELGETDPFLPIGEYAMGDSDPFLPIGDDEDAEVGEYAMGEMGEYAYG